jgi:hypothetical protein
MTCRPAIFSLAKFSPKMKKNRKQLAFEGFNWQKSEKDNSKSFQTSIFAFGK